MAHTQYHQYERDVKTWNVSKYRDSIRFVGGRPLSLEGSLHFGLYILSLNLSWGSTGKWEYRLSIFKNFANIRMDP